MLIAKLAYRNLVGAGIRTWLNAFILSLAFVMIIWFQGLLQGMNEYAMQATIDHEAGGGQYWHKDYDPYDPLTFEDSHAPLSPTLVELTSRGEATPVLVTSGAVFPQGRVQPAILRGIDPDQQILKLPTEYLHPEGGDFIPALIGAQMAEQMKLKVGDEVTIRWRDVHGTFDADDILIVQIMNVPAPSVDMGQIWLPLENLRDMLQASDEASYVILSRDVQHPPAGGNIWIHRDVDFLVKQITELIRMKSGSSNILYGLLLFMGLLAIFDTQVLAIWRRRKEIGTLMAMGMERAKVIGLFTFEGAMHGLLALIVGAIYGIPILALTLSKGLPMPSFQGDFGIALPQSLYPTYGLRLVVGTTLLVFVSVTIVSFLPAAKIAKLKPTDALRGKTS